MIHHHVSAFFTPQCRLWPIRLKPRTFTSPFLLHLEGNAGVSTCGICKTHFPVGIPSMKLYCQKNVRYRAMKLSMMQVDQIWSNMFKYDIVVFLFSTDIIFCDMVLPPRLATSRDATPFWRAVAVSASQRRTFASWLENSQAKSSKPAVHPSYLKLLESHRHTDSIVFSRWERFTFHSCLHHLFVSQLVKTCPKFCVIGM